MFDEIEKNSARENRNKPEKLNRNIEKGLNALSGHMLDDKYLPKGNSESDKRIENTEKTEEFDFRMQELHNKGKKRGRRYSYVGLISSALIMIVVIIAGYFMYSQVKSISGAVKEGTLEIEAVIDLDNLCNLDYCCLASLRRMNKNKFEIYDKNTGCDEGYEMKELECDKSLKWCEPGPRILPSCIKEGDILQPNLLAEDEDNIKVCCLGLNNVSIYDISNAECVAEGGSEICVKCSDGICGSGENYCNCPVDCEKPIIEAEDGDENDELIN